MGLLLLDLDGTIIENTIMDGQEKLQRRQTESFTQPALLPNRYEILMLAAEEGDSFAIVTNQGGVAWGYHTQAEVYQRIGHTVAALDCFWGSPFSVHIAWKMEKGNLLPQFKGEDGRKPGPAMLVEAMEGHGAWRDPSTGPVTDVIMVGDREEDLAAAAAAAVDFVLAEDFFAG